MFYTVGHDWSDLAAAAADEQTNISLFLYSLSSVMWSLRSYDGRAHQYLFHEPLFQGYARRKWRAPVNDRSDKKPEIEMPEKIYLSRQRAALDMRWHGFKKQMKSTQDTKPTVLLKIISDVWDWGKSWATLVKWCIIFCFLALFWENCGVL